MNESENGNFKFIEKERYFFIDILKTISIFMVITLHSSLWNTDFMKISNFQTLIQYSFRLVMEGVPLFMFINGFLIIDKNFDLKKHLLKTINIFIILYLWAFILTISCSFIQGVPMSFNLIVQNVLATKIGNKYTGVLWFLQKLIIIYLIFPVIKSLYDKNYDIYKYLFILLLISTFGINIIDLIIIPIKYITNIEIIDYIISFIGQLKVVITDNIFMVYFLLGGYVFKNKDEFSKNKYIFMGIVSTILAILYGIFMSKLIGNTYSNNYNYKEIFLLFTILGLYSLSTKIKITNENIKKIITSIGKNTMGIYLIHMIVITLINEYSLISNFNFPIRLLFSVIVLIISYLIAIAIRKIPKLSYIVKL